jgi:hypothetical protein
LSEQNIDRREQEYTLHPRLNLYYLK